VQRSVRIAGKADGDHTAVWVDFRSNQKNIYSSTLVDGTGSWMANRQVTVDNSSADEETQDATSARHESLEESTRSSRLRPYLGSRRLCGRTIGAGRHVLSPMARLAGCEVEGRPCDHGDTPARALTSW
jgi:hypothetical protein